MTLLAPEMLAWAAAAIPLVLLALAWHRPRHAIATSALWEAALAERSWLERAGGPLRLGLRVAVLELLVLAAADPRLHAGRSDTLALLLDASASMQTRDAAGTRFEQARAAALRTIEEQSASQSIALLAAGRALRVACPLTTDKHRLRAALADIEPSDGVADLAAAVTTAADLIGPPKTGRIVVFSNHSAPALAAAAGRRRNGSGRRADR